MRQCVIDGKSFKYILISRRQCFRAGVRYYMRGLDGEGHVANFVETEQIIEYNGNTTAIMQVRHRNGQGLMVKCFVEFCGYKCLSLCRLVVRCHFIGRSALTSNTNLTP